MSSTKPGVNAITVTHDPWYKYGVAFLFMEMLIAIAVCGYSLYMAFNGLGGFPGKH